MNRRSLLLFGAAAGATALLNKGRMARADGPRAPHFLLSIQIQPGMDNTYLFDARGRKVTAQDLKQNYLLQNDRNPERTLPGEMSDQKLLERTIVCERTGSTALHTPFVNELWKKHQDVLSVVNGVYMLRGNVGHDSNSAYLWGNTDVGGRDIFPPMVGKASPAPLQTVLLAGSFFQVQPLPSNFTNSAIFNGAGLDALGRLFKDGAKVDEGSPLWQSIVERADVNSQGEGLFAKGSSNLSAALKRTKRLALNFESLASDLQPPAPNSEGLGFAQPKLVDTVERALKLFSAGMTETAMIIHDENVDLHDAQQSQTLLTDIYAGIGAQLLAVMDLLKSTFYVDGDGNRTPFIELTTFIVSSEFGRTNRSQGDPNESVGATGADHNPFSNSVIIGGKGITPGLIVGESDLRDSDDDARYLQVSGAHREKNAALDSIMGKPFEFSTQRQRQDLPTTFNEADYICMPSVSNVILEVFGIDEANRFRLGSTTAPRLSVLKKEST